MKFSHFSRVLGLLLCLSVCLFSCRAKAQGDDRLEPKKLQVVCTLFASYDFAKTILGDSAEVYNLIPDGANPHSYEPSPFDIARIYQADMLIYTHDSIEPWVAKLKSSLPGSLRVVEAGHGVSGLAACDDKAHSHAEDHGDEHSHGDDNHEADASSDPHIWTSLDIAADMLKAIAEACVLLRPEEQGLYQERLNHYVHELKDIEAEAREAFAPYSKGELYFAGHYPLSRFTKSFGIEVKSVFPSLNAESEPSAMQIAQFYTELAKYKNPVIFFDCQVDTKILHVLNEGQNSELLGLHALHVQSREDTKAQLSYTDLVRSNIAAIAHGLAAQEKKL
ncbi:hypothetical protein CSB45_00805 [candidate division KSB3 bacterium]|uniref:Zinc ABC transporter substrate-binding protein n=1 Tax=candidate division KSB3 bacterium TaxID=2044937 RepID=A0A2G6ECY6_9BACT|nr:MAG: hypothetical protein CSB45_00805 [candidate division KSB3 bacterium]